MSSPESRSMGEEAILHYAQGNMHKFRQNPKLMKKLRQTGKRTLAEASDKDYINGIGISVKDAIKGKKWRGLNLLGKALVKYEKNE